MSLPGKQSGPLRALDQSAASGAAESWKEGFGYFEQLGKNRADKAALLLSQLSREVLSSAGAGLVVLDIGCAGGDVLAEISGLLPKASLIGIDVKPKAVADSQKKVPRGRFYQLDVTADPLPLPDASVDLTNLSAVCHELVDPRWGTRRLAILTGLLKDVLRVSRPGGKLVVREPTVPEDPSASLILSLSTDQLVTASRPRVAPAYSELTEAALFAKFLAEWIYLDDARIDALSPEDGDHEVSYEVPAWIVAEYARKRTFIDDTGNWESEMREQNAVFTPTELEECALAAGFDRARIRTRSLMEDGYYGEIKPGDGVALSDMSGSAVTQAEILPSHTYLIAEA